MMEEIRRYLLSVIAAALIVSILQAFLRQSTLKDAVKMVGGIFLMLVALSPLLKTNLDAFGQYLSRIAILEDEAKSGIEVHNQDLIARIIQEKTQAYILDKAEMLGLQVTVSVHVSAEESYPYPDAATLRGSMTPKQKAELMAYLENNLGIPKERQEFLP